MTQGAFYTAAASRRDTEALQDAYGSVGFIDAKVDPRTRYVSPGAPAGVVSQGSAGGAGDRGLRHRGARPLLGWQHRHPRQQGDQGPRDPPAVAVLPRAAFQHRGRRGQPAGPAGEPAVRGRDHHPLRQRPALPQRPGGGQGRPAPPSSWWAWASATNNGVLGNVTFTSGTSSWPTGRNRGATSSTARRSRATGRPSASRLEPGTEMIARPDRLARAVPVRPAISRWAPGCSTSPARGRRTTRTASAPRAAWARCSRIAGTASWPRGVEDVRDRQPGQGRPAGGRADEGDHTLAGFKGTLVRDRTDSRWLPYARATGSRGSYEQVVGDRHVRHRRGRTTASTTRCISDALDRKHILAGRVAAGDFMRPGRAGLREVLRRRHGQPPRLQVSAASALGPRAPTSRSAARLHALRRSRSTPSRSTARLMLRGVLFLDTGTVEKDFDVNSYRSSAGFGIRLELPYFGPVPMSPGLRLPHRQGQTGRHRACQLHFRVGFLISCGPSDPRD